MRASGAPGSVRSFALAAALAAAALVPPAARAQDAGGGFTMAQVTSYPFPAELVSSPGEARVAWVFNERGVRNVWVAEAPDWAAHRVTSYTADDGQELTNLSFSPDGRTIVYVRGGDHDSNWSAEGNLPPDPSSSPEQPVVQIWSVSAAGGAPKLLAAGDAPVISPRGDRVAFVKDHQIWVVPLDGSRPAARMFFDRGESESPTWSPDGGKLAFVSSRGDHSFIAVFSGDSLPIEYLAPSTSRDVSPRWSPDGRRIAYIRLAGLGGAPQTILEQHPNPFAIWTADVATGAGRLLWQSPATLRGSYPTTQGRTNLHWVAGGRLVFLADLDGWPHLYSIPADGGEPLLLTPGRGMAEYISPSPDGRRLVFCANMGKGPDDIDRRHLYIVPVDSAAPRELTPGTGLEWTPVFTGDGERVAFIGATAARPPLPAVMAADGGPARLIGESRIPADFPTAQLVTPRAVTFRASDGTEVHGQLFARAGGAGRRPAVVFVHGGPSRQMLLGWHYMDYYANSYAVNQYLASRGYVVLSVNYRLGVGYGHEFHHPDHAGPWGASEYQDVKAGAEYLRALPEVDRDRVGIWGGSYGGFLTALALARNSDLFAAGVDMHGVHDWTADLDRRLGGLPERYEKADAAEAAKVAWRSSPVSSIASWRSPVLLIQGDDDRNVRFHQTVDLARRLAAHGVPFEELVIPDEIHGFLRHASWLEADEATARFFDQRFHVTPAAP